MRKLRVETLDFIERAPIRVVESVTVSASPDQVFAAFADPSSWPQWFVLMRRAAWTSASIGAVGAEREVSLFLLGTFRERFIAWDPGERFAFSMFESTSPLADAIAEDYRLTSTPSGTRVDWVLAADPTLAGRALRLGLELTMSRVFRASGPRLERYLARR